MVKNKQRRNNKKTKAPPSVAAAARAMTLTLKCRHGSTTKNFTKGSYYCHVTWKYITFRKKMSELEFYFRSGIPDLAGFGRDHPRLIKDPEYCKFLFAFCIQRYLSSSYAADQKEKNTVELLLNFGIHIKYHCIPMSKGEDVSPGSVVNEKYLKYCRDVRTERGVINCLSRETIEFCDCMATKKDAAKAMEKLGVCYQCENLFSKKQLFKCSACHSHQYCSKKCQVNDWTRHKTICCRHMNTKKAIADTK